MRTNAKKIESNWRRKIVKSRSIVHVDNPPKNSCVIDEGELIKINKNRRKKSRNILLNLLEKKFEENKENYKFKTWDKLCDAIAEYMEEMEEMKKTDEDERSFLKRLLTKVASF